MNLIISIHNGDRWIRWRVHRIRRGRASDELDSCCSQTIVEHANRTVLVDAENHARREKHFGAALISAEFRSGLDIEEAAEFLLQRLPVDRNRAFKKMDDACMDGNDRLSENGTADQPRCGR